MGLREKFIENAAQFDALMVEMLAENTRYRNALASLVDLKKHKDKFGKDCEYLELQPKVWKQAFDALNT